MGFKGLSILHEWMNKNPLNSNFIQLHIISSVSIWKTTLHGHSFHTKIKLFYSLGTQYESEKWKWSHSVASNSSRPHGLQPTRLLRPWDFPGKSTGVGCHRLLLVCCFYKRWIVTFLHTSLSFYYKNSLEVYCRSKNCNIFIHQLYSSDKWQPH